MSVHDALSKASEALSKAEEKASLRLPGVKEFSTYAIEQSVEVVAILLGGSGIEGVIGNLPKLPAKMWGEALRLVEIWRSVEHVDSGEALELAREAFEIAAAIVLSSIR